ncbi:MAG: aldehyde dehydrogenase family protein [Betaproteobacteria bacterium]|nr:MAG: aldehyde dehydrogenase family protein [Betaproteobacteria bacterium]
MIEARPEASPRRDLRGLFDAQRDAHAREPYPSLTLRHDRLERLGALIEEHEQEIVAAIGADFGTRPAQETRLAELFVIAVGIRHARRNLSRWMAQQRVPTPLYLWPGRSQLLRQPLGAVGVISPWNYPVQLALLPVLAALAAGNRVMLKPSELTPRTSALLERIVAQHFAQDEFAVVTGGPNIGDAFSRLPFDHLFFTGSTAVGRKIALAAAANLTPVTLELGGKSPALIHADADFGAAAARLATGKLLNAGQTCIAPDYALVPTSRVDALAAAVRDSAASLYPSFRDNPDYSSIVNDAHYRRLTELINDAVRQGARAVAVDTGAEAPDASSRKLAPTVLVGVNDRMAIMKEEIFGPVLPIEAYDSLEQAIDKINARPRPLSLYMFGGDAAARRRVLEQTAAGGVTIDDTLLHFSNENLPFGGIGASGSGAYHGERGFLTFSHQKAVFIQHRLSFTWLLRPPYGKRFERVLELLKKIS